MSRMHKRRGQPGGSNSVSSPSAATSTPRSSSGGTTPTSAAAGGGIGGGVFNVGTTAGTNNDAGDVNLCSPQSSGLSPSGGGGSSSAAGGGGNKVARPRRFARKLSDLSSSRDASGGTNNNSSHSSISLGIQSRGNKDTTEEIASSTNSNNKPVFSPPRTPFGPMSSMSGQPSSPNKSMMSECGSGKNKDSSAVVVGNRIRGTATALGASSNNNSSGSLSLSPLQDVVPKKTDSLATAPRVDAILTEVSSCKSDVSSPGALANHHYHSHSRDDSHSHARRSLSEEGDDDDDDDESHDDSDDEDDDDESQSQEEEESDCESHDDTTQDDDEESHDDDEDEESNDEEEDESCTNSPKTTTTAETPPRRSRSSKANSPSKIFNSSNVAKATSQLSPPSNPSYNNSNSNMNMDMLRNALLAPPSLLNVSTASGASTACMHNLHSSGGQHLNNNDSTLSTSSVGGCGAPLSPPSNGSTPDRSRSRNRVPGGAAAKLILLRPQNSDEEKDDEADVQGKPSSSSFGSTNGGGGGNSNQNEALLRAFLGTGRQQQACTNKNDDDDDKEQDVSEINVSMNRAKTEFAIGSAANRRYYKSPDDDDDDDAEDTKSQQRINYNYHGGGCDRNDDSASMAPSIFNRNEVFHQTAAAAVSALLTPRHLASSQYGSGGSVMGGGCDAVSVLSLPPNLSDIQPNYSMGQASVTSAFQTPKEPGQEMLAYESLARRPVSPHLISETVESKLNKMSHMMQDPNKTLADLLTAINSPDEDHPHASSQSSCGSQDDDSRRGKEVGPRAPKKNNDEGGGRGGDDGDSYESDTAEEKTGHDNMDVGYLVRRKNACGALQVLTAPVKNRVKIAWTVGVLPALTSVLRDTGDGGLAVTFPDRRRRREFEAARNRAVACLMNLSMPKQNRIAVFHTPHLVHWLVVIILEGQGFPRKGCCAILALLSKSVDNRKLMVHVPELIEAATKVIKARPPRMESQSGQEEKADEFEVKEDDDASVASHDDASKNDVSKKASAVSDQQNRLNSVGSSFSNESDDTPRLGGAHSPVEISGYDETADELLRGSRQNIFAMLQHLVKEKDNAYQLVRHANLVAALSEITSFQSSPSHVLAVQMLACFSRHRLNTKIMVFKHRMVVPALVEATQSVSDETRLYACFALQNLAQDKSCRQELAVSPGLVTCLCDRSREATVNAERLAAISALKNLCDEPANLIPMTNTPDCIATLMHLAHGKEPGIDETMQYRACDALATLSHWLRKIATSGHCMENGKSTTPNASNTSNTRRELKIPKSTTNVFVPSLRVVTWNQWE
jgi:hypothetical protein